MFGALGVVRVHRQRHVQWSLRTQVDEIVLMVKDWLEGVELDLLFELVSLAYHTAELPVSETALFDDSAVLPDLLRERIHGLLGEVFKLEVGEEEVT